jgi:hypothetical protein
MPRSQPKQRSNQTAAMLGLGVTTATALVAVTSTGQRRALLALTSAAALQATLPHVDIPRPWKTTASAVAWGGAAAALWMAQSAPAEVVTVVATVPTETVVPVTPVVARNSVLVLPTLPAPPVLGSAQAQTQAQAEPQVQPQTQPQVQARTGRERVQIPTKRTAGRDPVGVTIRNDKIIITDWSAWVSNAPPLVERALKQGIGTADEILAYLFRMALPKYHWPPKQTSALHAQWVQLVPVLADALQLPTPPTPARKSHLALVT